MIIVHLDYTYSIDYIYTCMYMCVNVHLSFIIIYPRPGLSL